MSRLDETLSELGIPLDPDLAQLAWTHRSWAYENGGVATNERLEFLGDALKELKKRKRKKRKKTRIESMQNYRNKDV